MSDEPLNIRERLRVAGEEQGEKIEAFFSAALEAEREVWTTCEKCQRKTAVVVPDWSSRLKAVEALIDQGYGRAKAVSAEDEPVVIIVERIWPDVDGEAREHLTDEEFALVEAARELHARAARTATERKLASTRSGSIASPTGSTH